MEWRAGARADELDGAMLSIWEAGPGPADELGHRPGDRLVGSLQREDAVEAIDAVCRARRMADLADRVAADDDERDQGAPEPLTLDRLAAAAEGLEAVAGEPYADEQDRLTCAVLAAAAGAMADKIQLARMRRAGVDVIDRPSSSLVRLVEAAERLAAGA